MLRLTVLTVMVATMAAGCARLREGGANRNVEFEGQRFRANLSSPGEDRREMVITVTPVAVNPEAAQEAGRFEATKYCLNRYGGSDTEWTVGPDLPVERLVVVDDTITLQGRCTQR